jgi:hypothetical protein
MAFFEKAGVAAWDPVEPAECVAARVVRKPLGLEHGRGRPVVVASWLGHPRLQFLHRTAGGQPRFDLVVIAKATVVVESGAYWTRWFCGPFEFHSGHYVG